MAKLIFKDHEKTWRTGSDFPKIPLTKVSWDTAPGEVVAYVFFGFVNIDYDGSPTAYAPPEHVPLPDDDLKHAGDSTNGWYGVVALEPNHPDVRAGKAELDQRPFLAKFGKYPVKQRQRNGFRIDYKGIRHPDSDPSDPRPGYYVSGMPQAMGPRYLQSSYIDASEVPYGALSTGFKILGVSLGDYGLAIRHNSPLQSGFYFADRGKGSDALGECSHKVGKNLGGTGRGDSFNNNYPVSFIVFPQSFDMDPGGLAMASEGHIKKSLTPYLAKLSKAENANELPLLMTLNETAPKGTPKGTFKLEEFRKKPTAFNYGSYGNIVRGLAVYGFPVPPFPGLGPAATSVLKILTP
jgi:hypothetical protein